MSPPSRLLDKKDEAMRFLRPGSWLVQGTLGLAYPGSMESHVCLAEWCVPSGGMGYSIIWFAGYFSSAFRDNLFCAMWVAVLPLPTA